MPRKHINYGAVGRKFASSYRNYMDLFEQVDAANRAAREYNEAQELARQAREKAAKAERQLLLKDTGSSVDTQNVLSLIQTYHANGLLSPNIDWAKYNDAKMILSNPMLIGTQAALDAAQYVQDADLMLSDYNHKLNSFSADARERQLNLIYKATGQNPALREFRYEQATYNAAYNAITNPKETIAQRVARRTWENNALGKVSKKLQLTDTEKAEIYNYRKDIYNRIFLSDPETYKEWTEAVESSWLQHQNELKQSASNEPYNYYNLYGIPGVLIDLNNPGQVLGQLLSSAWTKDVASDYIIKYNQTQGLVAEGLIVRALELLNYKNDAQRYLDLTNRYAYILATINLQESALKTIRTDNPNYLKLRNSIGDLLEQADKIKAELADGHLYRNAKILASYGNPNGIASRLAWWTASSIDRGFDTDLGGIRLGLDGFGQDMDSVETLMREKNKDSIWLGNIQKAILRATGTLSTFEKRAVAKLDDWRKSKEEDDLDLADWKSGNNKLRVKANVSDYYKAQSLLLLENNYNWSNPAKMAMFGLSGIAGSSNASSWKNVISTTANIVGYTLGGAENAAGLLAKFGLRGAKLAKLAKRLLVAAQLGGIGVSYEANKSAGSDENNTEAANRASLAFGNSLRANGKYELFIAEGIKAITGTNKPLKDVIKNESDLSEIELYILDLFMAGLWHSTDPDIPKLQADAILGSNNLFYNDQPVNTADAAIDAVAWTARIAPIKQAVEAAKFKGSVLKRFIRRTPLGVDAVGNTVTVGTKFNGFKQALHGAAKKAHLDLIYHATRGVVGLAPWATAKAVKALGSSIYNRPVSQMYGFERKIAKGLAGVRAWAYSIPSAYLKATSTAKGIAQFALRKGVDTGSEMLQEGIQGVNSYDNKDEIDNAIKNSRLNQALLRGFGISIPSLPDRGVENRAMAIRVLDDILSGAQAALFFLNQNDPGFQSDADIIPSMNATPLLTLFGPNDIQVAVLVRDGLRNFHALDMIRNNIDASARGEKTALWQYYQYAKYANPHDQEFMNKAFDKFAKIAGKHTHAINQLNLLNGNKDASENDTHGIPIKMIEDLRKEYQDVVDYANNPMVRIMAHNIKNRYWRPLKSNPLRGIDDPTSDKYAKFVALLNYRINKVNETADAYKETRDEFEKMFGLSADAIYMEDDVDEGEKQKIRSDMQNARDLVALASAMRMADDYEKLSGKNNKLNTFLNFLKEVITDGKLHAKDYGIDIENVDDVIGYLETSNVGSTLLSMLRNTPESLLIEGDLNTMSMRDILETIDPYLRRLFLTQFDASLQRELYDELTGETGDPRKLLDLFNKVTKSDKDLERILEEDYVKTIDSVLLASAREVHDGDIYVGDDGDWYVVKRKKNPDGKYEWVKHRYYVNSQTVDGLELPFNPVEYDYAMTQTEKALDRRNKTKLENEHLANSSEDLNTQLSTDVDLLLQESDLTENQDYQHEQSEKKEYVKPIITVSQKQEQSETQQNETSETPEAAQPKYNIGLGVLVNVGGLLVHGTVTSQTVLNIKDGLPDGFGYAITLDNGNTIALNEQNVHSDSPYTNKPKYNNGSDVIYNGKRYTVIDKKVGDITDDTHEAQYIYTIKALDSDEQIDVDESNLQEYKEPPSQPSEEKGPVKPNKTQNRIILLLQQKQKDDKNKVMNKNGQKVVTGYNYFIKFAEGSKRAIFTLFTRVHGILDDVFSESEPERITRINILKRIEELLSEGDLDKLKQEIQSILNDYNNKISELFGKDSEFYNRFAIDLSPYLHSKNILLDKQLPLAIGSIVSKDLTKAAVVAGSIIDSISRSYFGSYNRKDGVENKPEYLMSDKAFNDLIKQLHKLDDRFSLLGWVLDTTPYTWYSTLADGRKMAGETDMIAIDLYGGIHILDFKTTSIFNGITIYDHIKQYKSHSAMNPEEEVWVKYTDESKIPSGAETRESYGFTNVAYSKFKGQGKRSYAAQYAMQLTAYKLMVNDFFGKDVVKSLEVIPFGIEYEKTDNGYGVKEIGKVRVYDPVDLTSMSELRDTMKDLEDDLSRTDPVATQTTIQLILDRLNNAINSADLIPDVDLKFIDAVHNAVEMAINARRALTELKDDAKKLQDRVFVEGLEELANASISAINKALKEALDEKERIDRKNNPPKSPETPNWENTPIEPVNEEDREHWWQFNNLHSVSKVLKDMQGWLMSIMKPDFVQNSEFQIVFKGNYVDSKDKSGRIRILHNPKDVIDAVRNGNLASGRFDVIVTYSPNGDKSKSHTFEKSIYVRLGNEQNDHNLRNSPWSIGWESKMARNLIRRYCALLSQLKPGEKIVAKNIKRTNGKLVYVSDENGQARMPIYGDKSPAFIRLNDQQLSSLINGSNSTIGFVDNNGNVVEIQDGLRDIIFHGKQPEAGTILMHDDGEAEGGGNLYLNMNPLPGNVKSLGRIPAGTVVYLYKFKNDEDKQDDPMRIVPIALRGRKIQENEALAIAIILSNFSKRNKQPVITVTYKDGHTEERSDGLYGFTYWKYLHLLLRFGEQAKYAGHEFYIGYLHEPGENDGDNDKVDLNTIEVTDMLSEPKYAFEDNGDPALDEDGNRIMARDTTLIHLNDKDDVARLVKILLKVDLHINQSGIMKANLNEDEPKGAFGALGAFFKDEHNSDVQSISILGMLFDRSDVLSDPNDNTKGLSGIGWMIKHGLATTNAVALENPLISIDVEKDDDLEIISPEKQLTLQLELKSIGEQKNKTLGGPASNDNGGMSFDESELQHTETHEKKEIKHDEPKLPITHQKTERKRKKKTVHFAPLTDEQKKEVDNIGATTGVNWAGKGPNRVWERIRTKEITEEQRKLIEKRIKRLIGRFNIRWMSQSDIDELLKTHLTAGGHIAGNLALDAMRLSRQLPPGTEYHETFHRILECLVSPETRQRIYNEYYKKFDRSFYASNGRHLDEHDIMENLAELFRSFEQNREHVRLHFNILKTFNEIHNYILAIDDLGSYEFAKLFIKINSGIFRFYKPNPRTVAHFKEIFDGSADLIVMGNVTDEVIEDGKTKKRKRVAKVNLDQFPAYGGRLLLDDAITAIIYALKVGYGVDSIANNAAKIDSSFEGISEKVYRGNESTKHSAWFRVITGEYANEDAEITMQDAAWYVKMFGYDNPEIAAAYDAAKLEMTDDELNSDNADSILKARQLEHVANDVMAYEDPDTLRLTQKMWRQLLTQGDTYELVLKMINRRLKKLGLDSIRQFESDSDEVLESDNGDPDKDPDDDSSLLYDIENHLDESAYNHPRSEEASAAVRFFLSTIPDLHFATEEDIRLGYANKLINKDGTRVVVKNRENLFGMPVFLSMNVVSNRLLLKCYDVRTAEELDEKLQELAKEDPIFATIARTYHARLRDSIQTYKSGDFKRAEDEVYVGKNKITVNRKLIHPSEYAQHYDDDGVYYTYVKDGVDTNERINNAVTLINVGNEAFCTQLFNYVASQKMDFVQVVLDLQTDEYGNDIDGKYSMRLQSSDSGYASSVFPRVWFTKFVGGDAFRYKSSGLPSITQEGKIAIKDAVDALLAIYEYEIHGEKYKGGIKIKKTSLKNTPENFDFRVHEFIKALNTLGIDINRELLFFTLNDYYKTDLTHISILKAFSNMIHEASNEGEKLSFKAFMDNVVHPMAGYILSDAKIAKYLMSSEDTESTIKLNGFRNRKYTKKTTTGMYIYTKNAFIKFLANGVSRYNKTNSELMTNGPQGTKLYTIAESHTANDITNDINHVRLDPTTPNHTLGSKVIGDMMRYAYNFGIQGSKRIGSIIIKHFLNDPNASRLKLHNNSGVRVGSDYAGGTSYKSITQREDWLSKAVILQNGGIIFPTLSDKSTWFYLTGCQVPGLNYSNLRGTVAGQLLNVGVIDGATDGEVHIRFNGLVPNAQIDLMIEYARCERNLIEKEINRWKNGGNKHSIQFWDDNRCRFAGLTELVYYDAHGLKLLLLLNDYSEKDPQKLLDRADLYFFNLSTAKLREIMTLTLEQGFLDNLATLERSGLIVANKKLQDKYKDASGKTVTKRSNRLFQYSNIGLDDNVISALTNAYCLLMFGFDNETLKDKNGKDFKITEDTKNKIDKAESLAILSYVWDIYMRGEISNEETERIFTGDPHFFKWVHEVDKDGNDKPFYDKLSKKYLSALRDRYSDLSKRLGGLGSTGEKNRLRLPGIKLNYRVVELKNWFVRSKLAEEYKNAFVDNHVRATYTLWRTDLLKKQLENTSNLSLEELDTLLDKLYDEIYGENKPSLELMKKELEDGGMGYRYSIAVKQGEKESGIYKDDGGKAPIDVADGAAYITPKLAKELLRMRGAYTEPVKRAFEYLEGLGKDRHGKIDPLESSEAYKTISDAMIGALKYSAYGYRVDPDMDIPIHYYDKFALFPIFECMATGFSLAMLKKMLDEHVDMVMIQSAVKTGSMDSLDLNQDMFKDQASIDSFLDRNNHILFDHSYEQPFMFIRRQLNTDAHDADLVKAGTLMTKIALVNLKRNRAYKTSDGKTIRGRQILDNIMTAMNKLSDIGRLQLENELFTDGSLDVDKFSMFLRDELESRDADENLIDGIEVIEKNGRKQFKVPLEAMSSVDWILSILVSKVNKKVVDINLRGNAFYLRSVWAMEGHPTVIEDNGLFRNSEINNGNDLKAVNNDGSMDAVISIDYYYDILPDEIKYNYKKARQWLFDHHIIGTTWTDDKGEEHVVNADTIASRIPTLAQSSIHALRFVDVLPVDRATIVLPREFTKITGSDFDIDKLYLIRTSYNVRTKYKDHKPYDIVNKEFKDGSEDFYRNQLINNYLTLLKDHGYFDKDGKFILGGSMQISMRSIDDDTSLIKNVLHRIEDKLPKSRYYAYQFGNLAFQTKVKSEFMAGKFGIGPFALNNNSLILTLIYGVKFAHIAGSILDLLGCESLANEYDKQGNLILSWLSGYINAHVDVAKDSYITRLGVNLFTWNLVNLLTRTGMGERTLLFTSQPIMQELSRVYDDASADFMQDPGKSKMARQKSAILDYIITNFKGDVSAKQIRLRMNNSLETNETIIGSYAKALFGIGEDGNYEQRWDENKHAYVQGFEYVNPETGEIEWKEGSILEDILTNPLALKNPDGDLTFDNLDSTRNMYRIHVRNEDGSITESDISAKFAQLLVAYTLNQLDKYAQKMSDLVNVCKIDTKKQGKNFVEQKAFKDKYDLVFNNLDGMFEQSGLDRLLGLNGESFIKTKTDNALELYAKILRGISLQATPTFGRIHQKIIKLINTSLLSKDKSKKVTTAIMSWIKKQYFNNYVIPALEQERQDENYADGLFYGDHTVQDNLIRLLNMLKRDKNGEFSQYARAGVITNPLIKGLLPDVYEDREGYLNPKMLKLENAMLDDSDNANDIERAWDDLYHDKVHYIDVGDGHKITFSQFAVDLAVYAFYTSGDRQGATKFFKYVPNTIRTEAFMHLDLNDNAKYGMSYADYIRKVSDEWNDPLANIDEMSIAREVILDNWTDNAFVKTFFPYKWVHTRDGNRRVALFVSGGKITKSVKIVSRNRKGKWTTKTAQASLNLLIAAVRFAGKGKDSYKIPTINSFTLNDDQNSAEEDTIFPLFIKVRQPSSSMYATDKTALYQLIDTLPINASKPELGSYPIYLLMNPETVRLHAGSFWYDMINPPRFKDGKFRLNVYRDFISLALNAMLGYNNEPFVSNEAIEEVQKENPKSTPVAILATQFIEALKNFGLQIGSDVIPEADEYLYLMISSEYQKHNIPITSGELDVAVEMVRKAILADTSVNEDKKKALKSKSASAKNDVISSMKKKINKAVDDALNKILGNDGKKSKKEQKSTIITKGKFTRDDAKNNKDTLYIFTDNADRTSGDTEVDVESEYAKKYPNAKFPKSTSAVVRGLPNAMPITTMKLWYKQHIDEHSKSENPNHEAFEAAKWSDEDLTNDNNLKQMLDDEFDAIKKLWDTGKYKHLFLPDVVGGRFADITEERTPKLYKYLTEKVDELKSYIGSKSELLKNKDEKDEQNQLDLGSVLSELGKSESKPINIYHKEYELLKLSANRPFVHDGLRFLNVYQAITYYMAGYAGEDSELLQNEIYNHPDVNTSQTVRRLINKTVYKYFTEHTESALQFSKLRFDLLVSSYESNPTALSKLLGTGRAKLINNGKEEQTELMDVREYLALKLEGKQEYKNDDIDPKFRENCQKHE